MTKKKKNWLIASLAVFMLVVGIVMDHPPALERPPPGRSVIPHFHPFLSNVAIVDGRLLSFMGHMASVPPCSMGMRSRVIV